MNKFLVFSATFLLSFTWVQLFGQLPPLQDEQDCIHALAVCQDVFVQPHAYQGPGKIRDEINPFQSCLLTGEQNDVWYTFTVQQAGDLCFSIIPNDSMDDYDWALFDLSNASCSDIYSQSQLEVSCNYHTASPSCGGITGANGMIGNACSDLNEACIPVQAGQVFYLNVSNFSASAQGYTLDFSASTADIYDQTPPTIKEFDQLCDQEWRVEFDEEVLVSSVDFGDLLLLTPGGDSLSISNIQATHVGNSYSKTFTFDIPSRTGSGQYELVVIDTILDKCSQIAPLLSSKVQHIATKELQLRILEENSCPDEPIQIQALGDGSVLWPDGSQDSIFSIKVDSAKWIHVESSFPNSCLLKDSIWVSPKEFDFPLLQFDSAYCWGDSLILPVISGDSNTTFSWFWKGNIYPTVTQHIFPLTDTGEQSLILQASYRSCPQEDKAFSILIHSKANFELVGEPKICLGNGPAQVELIASDTSNQNYTWSINGQFQADTSSVLSIYVEEEGRLKIRAGVSSDWGCRSEKEIEIDIFPSPELPELPDTFCEGEFVELNAKSWGNDSSLWNGAWIWNGREKFEPLFQWDAKEAGTFPLGIWMENEYGCRDSSWQNLHILPSPETQLTISDSCEGQDILIELVGKNLVAHWYVNGKFEEIGHDFSLKNPLPNSYVLEYEVSDDHGCQANSSKELNIFPKAEFDILAKDSICSGSDLEVIVKTDQELSYHWENPLQVVEVGSNKWRVLEQKEDFDIVVKAETSAGCESDFRIMPIVVLNSQKVDIRISDSILKLPYANLQGLAISDWPGLEHRWTWGDQTTSMGHRAAKHYTESGNYQVQHWINDGNGCELIVWEGKVEVIQGGMPKLPSAFSPNADGINDKWSAWAPPEASMEISIFDRWGKIVYAGEGNWVSWDGNAKSGRACQEGLYVYVMKLSLPGGKEMKYGGNINLIR